MGSKVPRAPDPRREPGDDDGDLPTDTMSRSELGLPPVRPKLRLEPTSVDAGPDDSTLIMPSSRYGVTAAAVPRTVRAWLEVRGGPAANEGSIPVTMVKTLLGRG